jgi:hypothetical protein
MLDTCPETEVFFHHDINMVLEKARLLLVIDPAFTRLPEVQALFGCCNCSVQPV